MNKKLFIISCILSTVALSAFSATYKINTGGVVTSPTGQTQNALQQQTQTTITPSNFYTNYNAQNYIDSKQVQAVPIQTIDIVMDYSGSMTNWINAAKQAMSAIVYQIPQTTKIGFRVFGHNNGQNPYKRLGIVSNITSKSKGKYTVNAATSSYLGSTRSFCSATARLVPISNYNANVLLAGMNSASIGGSTPLTLALDQAVNYDFAGMDKNSPKKIILITDGEETCGGNPCAFARELVSKRQDITIDVVLVSSSSRSLKCLAQLTGGKMYSTRDVSNFTNVLIQSIQTPSTKNIPTQNEPEQKYEFINN